MKNLIIFFIFCNLYTYSQTQPLFIVYDNKAKLQQLKSENDSITIFLYKFDYNDPKINNLKLTIEDGKLKKSITIAGNSDNNYLTFKYIGDKETGPLLVHSDDIINSLSYSEILNSDINNVRNVISKFKSLYIINLEDYFDGYYVARKVTLEPNTVKL